MNSTAVNHYIAVFILGLLLEVYQKKNSSNSQPFQLFLMKEHFIQNNFSLGLESCFHFVFTKNSIKGTPASAQSSGLFFHVYLTKARSDIIG